VLVIPQFAHCRRNTPCAVIFFSAPIVKVDIIPLPPVLIILVLPRTKKLCSGAVVWNSLPASLQVASLLTVAAFVRRCYPGCSSASEGCILCWTNAHCIIILRPHRGATQMRPIATDGVAWWSVCLSVCLFIAIVSHAKTPEPIEMLFGMFRMWTGVAKEPCVRSRCCVGDAALCQ